MEELNGIQPCFGSRFQFVSFLNKTISIFVADSIDGLMTIRADGLKSCNSCGFESKHQNDVKRHIESRHLELQYTCYYCSKVLKSRRNYQYHLRKHHPNQHHANSQ